MSLDYETWSAALREHDRQLDEEYDAYCRRLRAQDDYDTDPRCLECDRRVTRHNALCPECAAIEAANDSDPRR